MTPVPSGTQVESPGYRESHLAEGAAYHDKFVRGPYRSAIWEIEQAKLEGIVSRFVAGRTTPTRLLDFATGTGRILQLLEGRVASATGVDVSASMLEVAKGHLLRSELIEADLTREEALADRQFDLITAFRFFPNAEPALREEAMRALAALLAEDGILVINNHLRCSGSKMRLRRLRRRIRGKGNDRDLHCMTDREVESLAARRGLSIVESHPLAVIPVLKEKRPLLPKPAISWIERQMGGLPIVRGLANIKIHVLKHAASDSPEARSTDDR